MLTEDLALLEKREGLKHQLAAGAYKSQFKKSLKSVFIRVPLISLSVRGGASLNSCDRKRYVMIEVRSFREDDWPVVQDIYQQGIDTRNATFQEKVKGWPEWNSSTLKTCRLVVVEGDKVVGWAALSPVSSRRVYAGVAEVSVYVSNAHQGQGLGKLLLSTLVIESEKAGLWTLQAGIFPENIASIELHQKCGFRVVGVREKIGQMDGIWRDVLLLERRSKTTGI